MQGLAQPRGSVGVVFGCCHKRTPWDKGAGKRRFWG